MARGAAAKKEGTGSEELERDGSAEAPEPAADLPEAVNLEGLGRVLADLDFLRGLIAAVDESGIDTLDLSLAGTRIKLSKSPRGAAPAPSAQPPAYAHFPMPMPGAYLPPPAPPAGGAGAPAAGAPASAAAPAGAEAMVEEAPAGEAGAAAAEAASNLVEVVSPMVGTFYRAPAPEAPPYVEVGSRVTKGQTLCILEAMKLMNELACEVDGVVREILVDNAEPVEYGQVLFRIEPS